MDVLKAVLVTGASTGIGRKVTVRLSQTGYFVYAGARKDKDLRELGALPNVTALRLDVTCSRDITAAVEYVTQGKHALWAVVNNAGVATVGSVLEANYAEFQHVIAVNVCGLYEVTKAFAPLIVASRGRIIMIGSISGIIAPANLSAYSMSKHAVEALADCLAAEMESLRVHVTIIEPGDFETEILRNAERRLGVPISLQRGNLGQPDEVAAAIESALRDPRPKRRYLVVSTHDEARMTIRKQLEQLVQLNEGHRYTLDRKTLIDALDEALATAPERSPIPGESLASCQASSGST